MSVPSCLKIENWQLCTVPRGGPLIRRQSKGAGAQASQKYIVEDKLEPEHKPVSRNANTSARARGETRAYQGKPAARHKGHVALRAVSSRRLLYYIPFMYIGARRRSSGRARMRSKIKGTSDIKGRAIKGQRPRSVHAIVRPYHPHYRTTRRCACRCVTPSCRSSHHNDMSYTILTLPAFAAHPHKPSQRARVRHPAATSDVHASTAACVGHTQTGPQHARLRRAAAQSDVHASTYRRNPRRTHDSLMSVCKVCAVHAMTCHTRMRLCLRASASAPTCAPRSQLRGQACPARIGSRLRGCRH
jgi:hypothetical protein